MPAASSGNPPLLVVTADTVYADELAAALGDGRGFPVTSAGTVAEAMAVLRDERGIECIVTDHDTPDVDAIAFLETVRVERPDLPVILFTSEGDETVASRAIHAGVTEYLIKERHRDQWDRLDDLVMAAVERYRSLGPDRDRQTEAIPLYHAMPDLVVVLQDGVVEFVNRSGCDLLGVQAEEVLGHEFVGRFVLEDGLTAAGIAEIQAGDRFIGGIDGTLVDASGSLLPVEVTAAKTRWDGEAATVLVIVDRSEREVLERELRDTARLNEVLREVDHLIISIDDRERLEAAVCETFADSDPYLLAWIGEVDEAGERVVPRVTAGEDADYVDEIEITLDQAPTGLGPTARAVRTREPQILDDIAADATFTPWREAALDRGYRSSAAFPLVYADDLHGVLNLYADRPRAFDQQEMEMLEVLAGDIAFAITAIGDRQALERSRERLSLALEAADAGVWDWNLRTDTVVLDAGMASLLGIDGATAQAGDGVERPFAAFLDLVHPEERPTVERELRFAVHRNEPFQTEFRAHLPHAAPRWLVTLGKLVESSGGEPARVIGVAVDVTDRKERDLHLRVIDRVLRHNLRNDLNVISGNATTIRRSTEGEPRERASVIRQHAERLLSTAEKERQIVTILTEHPVRTETELATLLEEQVAAARERFPEATITLQATASPATAVTDRFERAIAELIDNAVEHKDTAQPTVEVRLAATADGPRITVADDGPPIPDADVGVLTGATEEPLYHGSGLGLWLVHWIVRRSNGALGHETNDPRGNVITIDLPPADSVAGTSDPEAAG